MKSINAKLTAMYVSTTFVSPIVAPNKISLTVKQGIFNFCGFCGCHQIQNILLPTLCLIVLSASCAYVNNFSMGE